VHRRNLEALAAGLTNDFVVNANEMVAELGELRAIALVRAGRQAVLLRASDPPDRILIGSAAARTTQPLAAVLVSVDEEGAFI
jgi:hypothetical protein